MSALKSWRAWTPKAIVARVELSDARCDALTYACLVAIMAAGPKYHLAAEQRLSRTASENGCNAPVITSAGALVDGIHAIGARRVALVAPYLRPLTQLVIDYLTDFGIEVVDSVSLEVADNLEVGRLDPMALPSVAERLDLSRADALVLSACVQMPSLPAIEQTEQRFGLPVLSAATATVYQILTRLGLSPEVPRAGALLIRARLQRSARVSTPRIAPTSASRPRLRHPRSSTPVAPKSPLRRGW